MTRILVVDDSRMDQHLAGSLLAQLDDADIAFAENGQAALGAMEQDLPDLVLTDLQMPGMSGLDLVVAIRQRFPGLPVILMTAHGSEEIAAAALSEGAASYVPKRNLADELIRTIGRVLALAEAPRLDRAVLACLEETKSRFVLDNDLAQVKPLIAHLRDQLTDLAFCDETGMMQIAVALDEGIVNAMLHGNLEVDSSLREVGPDTFYEHIRERRRRPPYRDRRVHVTAMVTPAEATYVVRDEGNGFDPSSLPDPRDPASLEKAGGRGMLLVRTFMDVVRHGERGTELTMVKRREA